MESFNFEGEKHRFHVDRKKEWKFDGEISLYAFILCSVYFLILEQDLILIVDCLKRTGNKSSF